MTVALILIFATLGSVVSLGGGVILLRRRQVSVVLLDALTAFAAGTLLGAAFLELLPESHERAGRPLLHWALAGVLGYFLLERFVIFFHTHRHSHASDQTGHHQHRSATVPLIILGDTIHNFLDGMVIAGTFLVSIPLGIVTSLAVAAHEVPQEIGDFAVLLQKGMRGGKVLLVNLASAAATLVAAMITYIAGREALEILPGFLALTAGFFLYIACSDLIPEIHHRGQSRAWLDTAMLLAGVLMVEAADLLFEVMGIQA